MHFISEKLDDYVISHSQKEPELLQELSRETWRKVLAPRMLSGHFQGRVLSMISKLINPKNILEIDREWILYYSIHDLFHHHEKQ